MPDADALKQNTTQERPANATWKKQRMTQRDISEEAAENEEGKRKEKEKKKGKNAHPMQRFLLASGSSQT